MQNTLTEVKHGGGSSIIWDWFGFGRDEFSQIYWGFRDEACRRVDVSFVLRGKVTQIKYFGLQFGLITPTIYVSDIFAPFWLIYFNTWATEMSSSHPQEPLKGGHKTPRVAGPNSAAAEAISNAGNLYVNMLLSMMVSLSDIRLILLAKLMTWPLICAWTLYLSGRS